MGNKPKKLVFRLILIGLLTSVGPGCYQNQISDTEQDGGHSATDTEPGSDADTDAKDSESGIPEDICQGWEIPQKQVVPSPEAGIEPTPEALCDASGGVVISNQAAKVTLNIYSQALHLATGQVVVAEQLEGQIEGTPQIEVSEAYPEEMMDATVSSIKSSGQGFSFDIAFPESSFYIPGNSELTVKVTLEVRCSNDANKTRQVESSTYFYLCEEEEHPGWVSSGGECLVCQEVCEMAASPIPASYTEDLLPLPGSPRAEIVPLAQFDRSVILSVEHNDTQGKVAYSWISGAGLVSESDQPIVVWELPSEAGPHLIQVVVTDDHSASVATFRWRHTAE